ncbi:lipase [Actinoplanes bogorensis]|uniref:Lipase n=1 Tax=Paractinoplanes bogorensis TaxID=1610840 RepID=A0ABS5YK08_9ACTN|nr:GDSL-type esterase/lipase family protein [Actinoplanes bogorensis]MBU2663819.1 lipase [Actinoplanes bogorensis]
MIDKSLIRGAAELETTERGLRPHRLPSWVRQQFPDGQLLAMEAQPSGVRVALDTAATTVSLVLHSTRMSYVGAERPRGRVDVLVNGSPELSDELTGGDRLEIDLSTGQTTMHPGAAHSTTVAGLSSGPKRVEFWLPHNESVELVDVRADAPVTPVTESAPQWVHYGSSISQGSNALAPSEIWPAVAARRAGLELRNLGFGGSAMVDPFAARVIRDAPADVISVKLGINVVNLDAMHRRIFVPLVHGFLDTIRDGHPETPLLLVSPVFCGIHEDTPGPGAFDPASFGTGQIKFIATGDPAGDHLTLRKIRAEMRELAERRDDKNLHYVDGLDLFGEADAAELPLPDALHPGPEAHRLIGTRFAALSPVSVPR